MKDIWVISDSHFAHQNIIKYCNRPFYTFQEMDEKLIENWNSVVKVQDNVWHLGDVYFGSQERADMILSRLNGHKRLLLGNHDHGKDSVLQKHFEKIEVWRMFKEFGLLLTHVPVHPGSFNDHSEERRAKYSVNVHGHIHTNIVTYEGTTRPDPRYKCVCVEQINYIPVHIETLRVK